MKIRQNVFALMLGLAVVLGACGGQDSQAAIETGIAQTLQIAQLETAAAGAGQATDTPDSPGEDQEPEETPTEEFTPTPSTPLVSVSVDTNCRSGPRVDYSLLTTILVGEEVEVVATFPGSDYVVVRRINGSGSCWLWLRYANRTDFSGYNLPVATQPPTSTPTRTPTFTPTYTPSQTYTPTWTPSPTP